MKIFVVLYDNDGELDPVGATLDYDAAEALVASAAHTYGCPEDYFHILVTDLYGERDVITGDDIEYEGD